MLQIVISLVGLALAHMTLGVLSLLTKLVELTMTVELVLFAVLATAFIWHRLTK